MRIAYVVLAVEFFLPFSVRASLRLLFVFFFLDFSLSTNIWF